VVISQKKIEDSISGCSSACISIYSFIASISSAMIVMMMMMMMMMMLISELILV